VRKNCSIGLHYLKNFHEANSQSLRNGLLYKTDDYDAPTIPGNYFIDVDTVLYNDELREHVYENWLRADSSDKGQIIKLRITVKACLYLLQTHLLCSTGELITDYLKLIDSSLDSYGASVEILRSVYENRNNFANVAPSTVQYQADEALACFKNIFAQIESKNTVLSTNIQLV
jgi:hypothetical protein